MHSSDKKTFQVLLVTFFFNVVVCLAKLIYGIQTRSLSLEADGFHSLIDSSSNIVALVGLFLASKPPDMEHPYGHRKIEALASMGISFLLFLTCYEILSAAIQRFQNPIVPVINAWSFGIMGITLGINFWIARYEKQQGELLKSDLLLADATHTRSDILVSISVVVSFIAILLNFPMADIGVALGIVIFIFFVSLRILSSSINILLDAQLLDPRQIAQAVNNIPGIIRCHRIRSRGTRHGIFVDLHIHVDPLMTTEASHRLTHEAMGQIKHSFPEVVDVLIHTEPENAQKKGDGHV